MKTRPFDPFAHMSEECMKQIIKDQGLEIFSLREENKRMREALERIEGIATKPVRVSKPATIESIRVIAVAANRKASLATTGGE